MIYRITDNASLFGYWWEFRACSLGVESRSINDPTWRLWSNTKTLNECVDIYRNLMRYSVSCMPGAPAIDHKYYFDAMRYASAGIKVDCAEQAPVATTHKCTCPWDGPTGVYAVGCKCQGV